MGDEHEHGAFDAAFWERHYQAGTGGASVPSPVFIAELAGLVPGRALDAGCGEGAAAVWLATQSWDVTAIDVSATAIERAKGAASSLPSEVSDRLHWLATDLTSWTPTRPFDLVVSQYVHPDEPFHRFVERLAGWVAPGGTLFVVGHDHADEHSGAHAPADASIGTETVTRALGGGEWTVQVAETRVRHTLHGTQSVTLHDLVTKALRKSN